MTRNALSLIIFFVFTFGLLYWAFTKRTNLLAIQPILAIASTTTTTTLAPRLSGSSDTEENESPPLSYQELQIRLAEERGNLLSLQQDLATLRQQRVDLQQQAAATSNIRVLETQDQIQNLREGLEQSRSTEDSIDQQAQAALLEQSSQARFAREQTEEGIRQQEQNIVATQNQMAAIARQDQNSSLSLDERQARMDEMNAALAAQIQTLQGLRAQRVQISGAVAQQTQALNGQTQEQKNALEAQKQATASQIVSLRSEVRRLQGAQDQLRAALGNLNTQLTQVESDYQSQVARVRELETELQNRQQGLSSQNQSASQ